MAFYSLQVLSRSSQYPRGTHRRGQSRPYLTLQELDTFLFPAQSVKGRLLTLLNTVAQFAAGWTIMLLETVRVGNRGRVVSYAGIFGLMVQNISWTITLPVWLSLHLLTSPIADIGQEGSRSTAWKALGVYNPWDTILVPLSVVQAFIVPAVLMSLPPSLLNHSAAAHYGWNAVWQAFPLWNVLILAILRRTPLANDASSSGEERGRPRTKATADPAQEPPSVSCVYNFALVLVISTHVPTLAVSLLPDSLRSFLVSSTPFLSDYLSSLITRGTFVDIFVPQSWPFSPHQLTVVPTAYASGDLAPLAAQFLQYDLLVASVPFFLWALYLRQASTRDANLYDALVKAGLWLVIGGPSGAVIVLLKQRDSDVTEDHNKSAKRFKWL